jgi:hypothetical protein
LANRYVMSPSLPRASIRAFASKFSIVLSESRKVTALIHPPPRRRCMIRRSRWSEASFHACPHLIPHGDRCNTRSVATFCIGNLQEVRGRLWFMPSYRSASSSNHIWVMESATSAIDRTARARSRKTHRPHAPTNQSNLESDDYSGGNIAPTALLHTRLNL